MITKIRQRNGIAIVEPNGKIMGPVASELWESILPQIEASDAPRVLINFEHVSKIDSSGLGALMVARATIVQKKGRVGGHQCRQTDQKPDCSQPTCEPL